MFVRSLSAGKTPCNLPQSVFRRNTVSCIGVYPFFLVPPVHAVLALNLWALPIQPLRMVVGLACFPVPVPVRRGQGNLCRCLQTLIGMPNRSLKSRFG